MSVAQISHQIQSIGFLTYIRVSGYTYPMILATHLTAICVFGGLILMTDLRILGLAMREISVTDVVGQLRRWKCHMWVPSESVTAVRAVATLSRVPPEGQRPAHR